MNRKILGTLEKVSLREAWLSESADFTPWLAQSGNLALLGKTIGIQLSPECQEKEVGPFRADILCRDLDSDDWVLIENQLERTDHSHLGQLLTYASGLNAVTIVWVAAEFTDEHRAALDWLNEHTAEGINFFGLEVELWRIGDSPVAPKFNIISQPNEWSRRIAVTKVNDLGKLQLRFWTAFKEYLESKASSLQTSKPAPKNWMTHALGRPRFYLSSAISTWSFETNTPNREIRAELVMNGPSAKREFYALENQKAAIEKALGFPLTWRNPENKAMCRLYTREETDFLDEQLWQEQYEWLRQRLETMRRVFVPIARDLDLDENEEAFVQPAASEASDPSAVKSTHTQQGDSP
jgi:hypothetical protein